jgi:tRNA G26 N,N-dimethylase Trm1
MAHSIGSGGLITDDAAMAAWVLGAVDLSVDTESELQARGIVSGLEAAGFRAERTRAGRVWTVHTNASREQLVSCVPAWARRGTVVRYLERVARAS